MGELRKERTSDNYDTERPNTLDAEDIVIFPARLAFLGVYGSFRVRSPVSKNKNKKIDILPFCKGSVISRMCNTCGCLISLILRGGDAERYMKSHSKQKEVLIQVLRTTW